MRNNNPTLQKNKRLKGNDYDESNVGWDLYITTEEDMNHPLSDEEGHYNGDVILLTSHRTYISVPAADALQVAIDLIP